MWTWIGIYDWNYSGFLYLENSERSIDFSLLLTCLAQAFSD